MPEEPEGKICNSDIGRQKRFLNVLLFAWAVVQRSVPAYNGQIM